MPRPVGLPLPISTMDEASTPLADDVLVVVVQNNTTRRSTVGALRAPVVYPTSGRPVLSAADEGRQIFDSTLNKPLWWDGTAWRDATGTLA